MGVSGDYCSLENLRVTIPQIGKGSLSTTPTTNGDLSQVLN